MDRKKKGVTINVDNLSKVPPQAINAEETILGAIILESDTKKCKRIIKYIKEDYFYKESHRYICRAILELYNNNETIDLITVAERLRRLQLLDSIGGAYGLTIIINRVSSSQNIAAHFGIVYQKYIERKIIEICYNTSNKCFEGSIDTFKLFKDFKDEIESINPDKLLKGVESNNEMCNNFISMYVDEDPSLNSSAVGIQRYELGHRRFDQFITMSFNKIILISGHIGSGKSRFTNHIVTTMADKYKDVSIKWLSLEDSKEDMLRIYLSSKVFYKPKELKERRFPNSLRPVLRDWVNHFNKFDIVWETQSIYSSNIADEFASFCEDRKDRFNILVVDNVMSLLDFLQVDKFRGDRNAIYDHVWQNLLITRQRSGGLIICVHHFNADQKNPKNIETGYRPLDVHIKGTEGSTRIVNQSLMINNPRVHKDLLAQYKGDYKEVLKHMFIVDAGKNRDDSNDDDTGLIHFYANHDFCIFKEIELLSPQDAIKNIDEETKNFIMKATPF